MVIAAQYSHISYLNYYMDYEHYFGDCNGANLKYISLIWQCSIKVIDSRLFNVSLGNGQPQ